MSRDSKERETITVTGERKRTEREEQREKIRETSREFRGMDRESKEIRA
jgi:hypothetical protein